METWTISRAGVINFWYYDEEIFHFEDGRLLLRGANGSGKSVTMQSLVPLLFDGNKSPERLDPFGSRARKMDNYLLSDRLDLEERTGYLFLEFEKSESKRYITIGMGMRARKNMPMQTWYFIILDNRRIGFDISLYKDLGDKIPLTQKELENKIAQGGQVFTKQADYKAAVNEHLFGYADLSDFDELITLLIQIRSPKLSKEFKPTTMYEIMQNSLVTLTDDDLRPMSEAIENMDEIKLKIESLNISKKAISRINTAYDKYNEYMISTKANRLLKYSKEKLELEKKQDSFILEEKEHEKRLNEIETLLEKNKLEEEQITKKEESLKNHDLSKLADEKEYLKKNSEKIKLELEKKKANLENQETKERGFRTNLKALDAKRDIVEVELKEKLEQMNEEAEIACFDEHDFFEDEYNKSKGEFDFKYHKEQVNIYRKHVYKGLTLLEDQQRISQKYDEALRKVDDIGRKIDKESRALQEFERQFNQIKEEFAEKTFKWAEHNQILRFEKEVLQQVTERIYTYGEQFDFEEALKPLKEAYQILCQRENIDLNKLIGDKEKKEEEIRFLKEEYKKLELQKELEPQRSESVIANRKALTEKQIPFIPLYKVLDFSKDTNESQRDYIEESLEAMGILDALLVAPEYKDIISRMDAAHADKYLFAKPEILSHNLSHFVSADTGENIFSKSFIEDILMSILLDDNGNNFFVSENGQYGMGIIKGKVSGKAKSRFIGATSRKRYKLEMLAEIMENINDSEKELSILENEIVNITKKLENMAIEFSNFPNNKDLEVAKKQYFDTLNDLNLLQREERYYRQESELVYKELKDKNQEVIEATRGLSLSAKVDVYKEAYESLLEYNDLLMGFINVSQQKNHILTQINSYNQQLEDCIQIEDELRYDIGEYERQVARNEVRLIDIAVQLDVADFKQIEEAIEHCHRRRKQLPLEYSSLVDERASRKAACETIEKEQEALNLEKTKVESKRALYEDAFKKEYILGYVSEYDELEMENLIKLAKKIMDCHGAILDENKTIVELTNNLKERVIRETGELAEYHLKMVYLFKEIVDESVADDDRNYIERTDLSAKVQGKNMKFYDLAKWIDEQIVEQSSLLSEQDRALFEEILINSVSRKISGKIYQSERWVKKIDELMSSMDNSSGLSFYLKWVPKEAENEEQLGTKELIDLLRGDQALLTRVQKDKLIGHFQSKIIETKSRLEDSSDNRSFLTIMKEILDYRKWFQFQLYFAKTGERKKELTNNAFFTFSGGEKAMAMYVPLFSAVYAKYSGANKDCPKVVSLDEAFAGVDEKNIRDMFRLLVKELNLSFIANSQVLFGDYDTVPALSIYELIRPENANFVTLIRYKWNGNIRELVLDEEA